MDLLRGIALLLAVAAISFSGELAYAQQEVDPDHFDHPTTQSQKAAPAGTGERHHQEGSGKREKATLSV